MLHLQVINFQAFISKRVNPLEFAVRGFPRRQVKASIASVPIPHKTRLGGSGTDAKWPGVSMISNVPAPVVVIITSRSVETPLFCPAGPEKTTVVAVVVTFGNCVFE